METNSDKRIDDSRVKQKQLRIKERLNEIGKALLTLEWDKQHNQLNMGMEAKYAALKEEHEKLEAEIGSY